MTYAFAQHESIGPAVKRIAREQLDQTIEDISSGDDERDERVHDARQRLKKLRGLLRLVRREIGQSVFARENACFRDAARELAAAREAAAIIESFDGLLDRFELEVSREAFDDVRKLLVGSHRDVLSQALDPARLARVDQMLKLARERVPSWPIARNDFRALAGGFRGTYRRGRRVLRAISREPSVRLFHDFRRIAKYHLHHVRLLEGVWRSELKSRRKSLEELSDALGDLHDLDGLRRRLAEELSQGQQRSKVSSLLALVDRRIEELGLEARSLGARIYAEKPEALTRRFRTYFEAWRFDAATAHERPLPRAPVPASTELPGTRAGGRDSPN